MFNLKKPIKLFRKLELYKNPLDKKNIKKRTYKMESGKRIILIIDFCWFLIASAEIDLLHSPTWY